MRIHGAVLLFSYVVKRGIMKYALLRVNENENTGIYPVRRYVNEKFTD